MQWKYFSGKALTAPLENNGPYGVRMIAFWSLLPETRWTTS